VVDNDFGQSAKEICTVFQSKSYLNLYYCIEPEQNIAIARNVAVENAIGDFIAFIDDDEFPCANWLLSLYNAINRYNSDGILGPVVPHFEKTPPNWVLKGRIFERPTHSTGHVLEGRNTRTGNVLLKRELFTSGQEWFDPAFGSGGEDRDFFRRKINEGKIFVWSNEAQVFETIPPARWKRTILMKRALLRGKISFNDKDSEIGSIIKSACAIAAYSICLPVLFVLCHHVFMKILIKDCDHFGKILAFSGIDWVKEKYVGGQ
jgi:succinoglycan biosynthesis protein ExoM